MPSPRILVLFNEPVLPPDHPDAASERDILDTVNSVARTLRRAGFRVGRLGVGNDLTALADGLEEHCPDAVFNLFEGLSNRPFTESVVAGMLEWLNVPFTGCPSDTLTLARDKQRTKHLLHGAGLPTAPFFTVDHLPVPECKLEWPVIVKPANQDASCGIEQESVVQNQAELISRVELILKLYGGSVLVEQFIVGREILASVVEGAPDEWRRCTPMVLPLAEIVFNDPELWPVYSYDAKWDKSSNEYRSTPMNVPVILPHKQMDEITDLARRAFRLLGCRDYARVDIRMTAAGRPFILEVNPNPFIDSIALIDGMEAIGSVHSEFIADLARAALSRRPPRTVAPRKRVRAKAPRMQEAS
jgi:D-alanine-D-alanine ligase